VNEYLESASGRLQQKSAANPPFGDRNARVDSAGITDSFIRWKTNPMIRKIQISSVASYIGSAPHEIVLKNVNYVYGANGSGKTTISRVIADISNYPTCCIEWDGVPCETAVYNQDFVNVTFRPQMQGIFTLGEANDILLKDIDKAKQLITALDSEISALRATVEGSEDVLGLRRQIVDLANEITDRCWQQKQKFDTELQTVFQGFRSSRDLFTQRLLRELSTRPTTSRELSVICSELHSAFNKTTSAIATIDLYSFDILTSIHDDVILQSAIVGKMDTAFADLITHLRNSDWVRQGMSYLDQSLEICPFCQQQISSLIPAAIADYFDKEFERQLSHLDQLDATYTKETTQISIWLDEAVKKAMMLEIEHGLEAVRARLSSALQNNINLIKQKRKEPSSIIVLQDVTDCAQEIISIISAINKSIETHNLVCADIDAHRARLVDECWKYVASDAYDDLYNLRGRLEALKVREREYIDKIREKTITRDEVLGALRKLEREVTSVQPTVDMINSLLESFGFRSFRLRTAGDEDNLYELVRPDGQLAIDTLSEGERTFLVFLYFYHLLSGSLTADGVSIERIVVFDDPVSSLDTDVLFIVSSLIRRLAADAKRRSGSVRQVVVLTHNVYFHKEVSFDKKRPENGVLAHETFWTIRKGLNGSSILSCTSNPVRTSYEMHWREIRDDNRSPVTIQNTLRRIIENYFKILGGIRIEDIKQLFSGSDLHVCSSLLSWMHDGSHYLSDDLYVTCDEETMNRYIGIFREIFVRTNHLAHYNMMMGIDEIED
jgi:wobble nucleotide-excising tRNase